MPANISAPSSSAWKTVMVGSTYDPNNDQQSSADSDLLGNATNAMLQAQAVTASGDTTYYYRVRVGSLVNGNASSSFYLALDLTRSGNFPTAELFVEARYSIINGSMKKGEVVFHKADFANGNTGFSPSTTAWSSSSTDENLEYSLYSKPASGTSGSNDLAYIGFESTGSDLDGDGNNDYWVVFAFTLSSLNNWAKVGFSSGSVSVNANNVVSSAVTGSNALAMFAFTSTSQTANGDVAGVNDRTADLTQTWSDLGVVINSTLDDLGAGKPASPTVDLLTTADTTPVVTGTAKLADTDGNGSLNDTLAVVINGVTYSGANVKLTRVGSTDTYLWAVQVTSALTSGTYSVTATATRDSTLTATDTTSSELVVNTALPAQTPTITLFNDNVSPDQGDYTSGARTNDTTPTVTGVLDAALAAGSVVRLYQSVNGGSYVLLGTATVSGTGWTYTTSALTNGSTYTYRAVVWDGTNEGTRSNQFNLTIDTTAPTVTAAITGYSDDVGASKGNVTTSSNGTTPATDDSTPTLYGTFAGTASATTPPLAAGERLAVYRAGSLVGYANLVPTVNSTDGSITGYTWEYPEAELASGTYSYTVRIVDGAGNLGTQSSAFAVTVSLPVDVNDISVNEASAYAVFKVSMTASAGANLTLSLSAVTATVGSDYSSTLQVSTDGTTWSNYSSSFARGSNTTLWVRTAITNDGTYEGAETFRLTVSDGTNSAVGVATILDDGTGSVFTGNASGGSAVTSGTPDDDRTISVSASQATVNEASNYAFFTVTAQADATVMLDPRDVNDSGSGLTANLGSAPGLYYSLNNGLTWNTYTSAGVVVPSGGSFLVRVDITAEQDTAFENSESLGLRAWYQSNSARLADGTVTLRDNNSGVVFNADGTTNGSATLDNDTGPSLANATVTLNENSANGTAVTNVNDAISGNDTDAAGAALTYSITAGNTGSAFTIDASTGAITVANGSLLNFEGTPSYALTVSATNGSKTATGVITVNLLNVNEAPSITSGATGTVAENAATSTVVYTVTATDPDANPTLTYSIGGTDAGAFDINASTGAITLKASADFETKSSYLIDVIVTDQGGLTDTRAVTINVTNVNETPVVTSGSTGTVAENAAISTVVYTATSTDPDAGQTHTYSLAGTDAGSFDIDSTTGAVTLKASANFEAKSSYSITIRATDNGTPALTGTKAVTINVTDVNEAPTVTSGSAVTISNGTAAGATVYTTTATDPDAGQTLTYSLSGTDAAAFTINSSTGVVTINSTANYATKSSYSIDVVATDNGAGTLSNSKAVTVTVSSSSNQAPVITSASTATVVENTAIATPVYTAAASDSDAGQTLTYSLGTGGDEALFSIDANSGAVRLLSAANFESKSTYSITVRASDNGTPSLSASQVVTINVTNVDEVAPTFTSGATASAAENQNLLYTAAATDTDFNSPATANSVTYSLKNPSSGDANLLNINSSTGAVTLKTGNLDFEGGKTSYAFTVIATDAANNATELPVTVTVSDVNEAPTAVALTNQTSSLAENTSTASRVKVADIGITDDALGTNAVTLSGADASYFEVVGNALYLKAGTVLNYEAKTSYAVTVSVADASVAGSTPVTASFTLSVTNVDEVAPAFTSGTTASVSENQNLLYTAAATDTVDFTNQVVTYSLKPGVGDAAALAINPSTGAVRLASGDLDYESKTTYSFTVVASDATGNAAERAVSVAVTDLAESVESLTVEDAANAGQSPADTSVVEGGTLVYRVTLPGNPTVASSLALTISGTSSAADRGALQFSNGVTLSGGNLQIPGNVKTFTIAVPTIDDGLVEPTETLTIGLGGASATGTITDNDTAPPAPVITDVTEIPSDPTPNDLYTADTTQVLKVTGRAGHALRLYAADGNLVTLPSGAVTETSPGNFSIDAQSVALSAGDYIVRQIDSFGNESADSNRFTIDSAPALEEMTTYRVLSTGNVLNGRLAVIDQGRNNLWALQTTSPPTSWVDADGQSVVFGLVGGSAGSSGRLTLTAASGSTLTLDPLTAAYTYTPAANAVQDIFTATVRDPGGKGGNLTLTFEPRDLKDRDGVPGASEDALASRLAAAGNTSGDRNGDGVPDSQQNAVTTLAWVRKTNFDAAVSGQVAAVPTSSIITVVTHDSTTGTAASAVSQLIDFKVLGLNRDGTGSVPTTGLAGLSTPWDPIGFSIEPLQSLGLIDIDPNRAGLQTRVTLDISASALPVGTFTAYKKWIAADTIAAAQAAGVPLITLDGVALTNVNQAGWYDFTQRAAGGDGARFITANGIITGIELILTDNAFGDVDFTVGRITDPGMPTGGSDNTPPTITGPTGGAGAAQSAVAVPENRRAVTSLSANEVVDWSIAGGVDGALFSIDASGALSFSTPADYERPIDSDRNNVYTVIVRARDAAGNASLQTVQVTVTDVDDTAPLITGPSNGQGAAASSVQVSENTVVVATLQANEAVTWDLVAGADRDLFSISADGTLRFLTAPDFEQPRDAGRDNFYEVTVRALDRSGNMSLQTVTVQVLDVDEVPPVITGPSGGPGAANSARQIPENTTAVARLSANEPVTWSLAGGPDAALLRLDADGTLRFAAAPDFERPGDSSRDNLYEVQVRATDAAGNASLQTITITVTDVDEIPPLITGPSQAAGSASSSTAIPENTTAVTRMRANEAVTWSIVGGADAALLRLDADGTLRFAAAPDFEQPADADRNNRYEVQIRATDLAGNVSVQSVSISITDVDEVPPKITGPGGAPGTSFESVVVPENTQVVTSFEADEPVIWALVDGRDASWFTLSSTGALSFKAAPDYEAPWDSDGNNVYELQLRATDRAGNVSLQSVTVRVSDVDEIPPVISGPGSAPGAAASAVKVLENASDVFNLKADEPVKWSIVGGVDAALFSLGEDGALKFIKAPDYEKPLDSNQDNIYAVTIRAVDTQGNASEQNILVTVDDVNEPQALFVLSLRNGDRWMSGSWAETAKTAAALGVTPIKGDFSVLPKATVDTVPLKGWLNFLTGDFLYIPLGTSLPYSCYVPADTLDLNHVLKPGKGSFDVHLFVNSSGVTQTVGLEQARQMGLSAQGYQDMGAIFASAAPWEPGPVALVGSTPDAMPGFGG